jgi:hypothetical protein
VPAYHRGELITTAYALLAHDLLADPDGLVTFRTDRIDLVKVKHGGEIRSLYFYDHFDGREYDAAEAAATIRDPRRG